VDMVGHLATRHKALLLIGLAVLIAALGFYVWRQVTKRRVKTS
jgi:hypothetical protein